ncbi:MAG TPA: hypothetical protein VNO20_05725 [Solirubrobacterales bacterium]|nr:hypothetical protein [Solirubrobacterales bacterium]
MVGLLAYSAQAHAAPPVLWEKCPTGSAAGECFVPRGLASDPSSGHLYVANQENRRIEEFDVWGTFLRAFGWGVVDGSPELQTCDELTECLPGLSGSGTGEFKGYGAQGVAVDGEHDVYVVDLLNQRVQKFDLAGSEPAFEWMVGGGVNQGPNNPGNLCTAAHIDNGDTCGAGSEGSVPGQFGWPVSAIGSNVAVDTAGTATAADDILYVGDEGRIQEFDTDGTYHGEIALAGETVQSLAVDPSSGDLYVAFKNKGFVNGEANPPNVHRIDPLTGSTTDTLAAGIPRALAVDPEGTVYVFDDEAPGNTLEPGNHIVRILEFDSTGNKIGVFDQNKEPFVFDRFDDSTGLAIGTACGLDGDELYLSNANFSNSFVRAYGPPPDPNLCPPPANPPTIADSFALSVETDAATLKAQINPRFWPDATYYVQYGSADCSLGGCASEPVPPGTDLTDDVIDANLPAEVELSGLEPDTTYHYRFVAQSSGGGPVFGPDQTFTTFPEPAAPKTDCPNQALRTGPSAALPDCRAYELVSPLEKDGGINVGAWEAENFNQAAPEGGAFSYSSKHAFADPASSDWTSQYLAKRDPAAGWQSRSLNPPRFGLSHYNFARQMPHMQGLSEDLCLAFFVNETENPVAAGDQAGYPDLYRRRNCEEPQGFETLTIAPPKNPPANKVDTYWPRVQGFSADGSKVFLRANGELLPTSPTGNILSLYLYNEGALRLVSVLPSPGGTKPGAAATTHSSLGTPEGPELKAERSTLARAVSEDGSRVYWTATDNTQPPSGSGFFAGSRIYLRLNPDRAQSPIADGECTKKADRACTLAVSETVDPGPAHFWTATPDGSRALFSFDGTKGSLSSPHGGELYLYDLASESSSLIAGGLADDDFIKGRGGVLASSEDLSRIYLVSTEVLDAGADAGEQNLYLYEQGSGLSFIATLGGGAADRSSYSARPFEHLAHATADGEVLVFMSQAPLTGVENTDAISGEADGQVFRYEAATDQLRCVSCNPTGARPDGRLVGPPLQGTPPPWLAARIPGWEYALHESRVLSDDGSRLFFESFDRLLPQDENGKADVYQWQAPGTGDCEPTDPSFFAANGGCLSLVSSGQGESDSSFLDASATGDDVFIGTDQDLVSVDEDLRDVYDARVGGGFAYPPVPPPCLGDACQGAAAAAPSTPSAGSAVFSGPPNQGKDRGGPKGCPKGRRKVRRGGKVRCVKPRRRAASQRGRAKQ